LSDSVSKVNALLGIGHKLNLVNVHESNGVERTNQEILKLLRTLCNYERIRTKWSKPWVLGLVEYQLNSVSTETQHSALELSFGTADLKYFHLPDALSPDSVSNVFLRQLNATIATVRDITHKYQEDLIAGRKSDNPPEDKTN